MRMVDIDVLNKLLAEFCIRLVYNDERPALRQSKDLLQKGFFEDIPGWIVW